MKSTVINNFIDNKIRIAVADNKSIDEIIELINERIDKTKKSEALRESFKRYMIGFSRKRIDDVLFVSENFSHIPMSKMLNLIKFRDKVSGMKEIEIDVSKV